MPDLHCQICKKIKTFPKEIIHKVDTLNMLCETEAVSVKCLFDALVRKQSFGKCCRENVMFQNPVKKCILLELLHPISLDLTNSALLYGQKVVIM